jgi:hypothetical protein
MGNLALFGCNGGKFRHLLGYALAAALRADCTALFEISDVQSSGKLFVAILAEKNVLRHDSFLPNLSSLPS